MTAGAGDLLSALGSGRIGRGMSSMVNFGGERCMRADNACGPAE